MIKLLLAYLFGSTIKIDKKGTVGKYQITHMTMRKECGQFSTIDITLKSIGQVKKESWIGVPAKEYSRYTTIVGIVLGAIILVIVYWVCGVI